jgi:hypothetical protein
MKTAAADPGAAESLKERRNTHSYSLLSRTLLVTSLSVGSGQWLTAFVMNAMTDNSRQLRAFAPALILLAICAVINHVDRGNLSIAAPLLKDKLRISASQLGILSPHFW